MLEETLPRVPIGVRLRAETCDLHAEMESRLAFLTPEVQPADYVGFLTFWHGFHRVLEPRLDRWHRHAQLLDWPARRKLHLLEADLRTLGVDRRAARALPACPGVPEIDDSATALGVLYVVEGATLGGAVLRRRLAGDRLPGGAFHFLSSSGPDVGRRWQHYRAVAASWVESHPDRADQLVGAARRTFEVLIGWTPAEGTPP